MNCLAVQDGHSPATLFVDAIAKRVRSVNQSLPNYRYLFI
uniref:Uncharacterized protein n=1 Tax=Anguilla anguilla TaxID=7936 RepID=A0A0E9PDV3_ANGAN